MALPVKPPDSNIVLYLTDQDGNRIPDADLHGTRCIDADAKQFIETHWRPDEGERRALANGAPIILNIWGQAHPPVRIVAGEPDVAGSGVLLGEHVNRALGLFFAWLADMSGSETRETVTFVTGRVLTPDEAIDLWGRCLLETATNTGDGGSVPDTPDAVLDAIDRSPAIRDDEPENDGDG